MVVSDDFPRDSPFHKKIPSEEAIRGFCEQYGIGNLKRVGERLGGYINVNQKIETTKGLYAVRVLSGFTTPEHVEYIEEIISLLLAAGVPALMPLRTPSGERFIEWGDRLVMMTPFVAGHGFERREAQAQASGRMLRKVHNALADAEAGPIPHWSNYPSDAMLSRGLKRLHGTKGVTGRQVARAERLHDLVMDRWHEVGPDLPITIIHGDWHPGNQVYSNGKVKCILDFDFVRRAERLHDVAYAVWSLLPDKTTKPLVRSFLDGYGAVMPRECIAMPIAIARAALFFICTASYNLRPVEELLVQLERQGPLIEWLLSSDGEATVQTMCPVKLDEAA